MFGVAGVIGHNVDYDLVCRFVSCAFYEVERPWEGKGRMKGQIVAGKVVVIVVVVVDSFYCFIEFCGSGEGKV